MFRALEADTQDLVDEVFALLGWKTKVQVPFSEFSDVLGVTCDLRDMDQKRATFATKKLAVKELVTTITEILDAGEFIPAGVRSFRDRCQFASCQTFGRCASAPIRVLGQVADSQVYSRGIPATVAHALRWLREYFTAAVPRTIRLHPSPPVVIFTDGFCEPGFLGEVTAGVGGVMFDPDLPGPQYFGLRVPSDIISIWTEKGDKKQVVGQAELLPVNMAKEVWSRSFINRAAIWFLDNDSARYGLISGSSRVPVSSSLIFDAWQCDAERGTLSWYARVPTRSNVADGPSRLEFSMMRAWPLSEYVVPSFPECKALLTCSGLEKG